MSDDTTAVVTRDSLNLDQLGRMLLDKVEAWSAELAVQERIVAAAKSDDAAIAVVNMRPDHAKYAEWQALVAEAEAIVALIDAENKPKVKMPTEAEVESAESQAKVIRDEAKAGINYLTSLYPGIEPLIPSNLGKRRGGGSHSTGTGKRPRLDAILVTDTDGNELLSLKYGGKDQDNGEKPTFSNLAKWISDQGTKVETRELQEHAFSAAGTQDLSDVAKVEFAVTVGENHYMIYAAPRAAE